MRSLTPTTVQVAQLSSAPGSRAAQLVPDPESGSVYVAVERVDDDGVEVDIVRLASLDEGAEFSEVRKKLGVGIVYETFSSLLIRPDLDLCMRLPVLTPSR